MKIQALTFHSVIVLLFVATGSVVSAQDYHDQQDYYGHEEQDNLYQDYAQHQQVKAQGGGGGMVKSLAFGAAGWFIGGKIHSKRAVKKANKKATEDLQGLYTRYVKDVTMLQTQNAELEAYIKQSSKQQLVEEFLQADVDNNRQVSRAEYERHKNQYLSKHPEFVGQFPRFEDFDPDGNGMITIAEHENYYEQRGMI
mmetsp:Transcript_22222/g.36793  ORF Transcript_22222/g.36793 Transcript_22222/m.36793 type:complete len:197 (+) Transcript_22222:247-837(+)|eukprot:CAMPEP_0119002682 /NCGR_PEP_ID=MMETSP1176-20130426/22_1 /TAXON_ID=265551 /ORGANISM="Synedropsis recta cf, Strain CCMP1620" /LENGTH=196 /DNA_ID=CAMNT_0006954189 /DNA_START=177 /DNA_END=767 /DNA_ORIENTATION=+